MGSSFRESAGSLMRGAVLLWAAAVAPSCHAQPPAAADRLAPAFVRQADHTSRAYSVAFSRDGKTLASGSWDGTVKLRDVASGSESRTLAGHGWGIYKIAFSPEGKQLASASRDGTVRVWDTATGANTRTLAAGPLAVKAVAWSPDGRLLATGGNNGVVKLWDAASGRALHEAAAHAREPDEVAFSPDGRLLATGGADGGVKLWDSALKEVKTLSAGPAAAKGLKVTSFDTPDPERVLPNTPAGLRLLEWFGLFNTGNVYLMGGFARDRFAPSALARKSADERALEDFKLYREVGELELGGVERAADDELTVFAQSLRTKEWISIRLQVEAAEPRGVTLVETRRIPAPPKPAAR